MISGDPPPLRRRSNCRRFYLFTVILSLLLLPAAAISDIVASRSALLSLRAAVGGRTLLWNTTEPTPCNWVGVECRNDVVYGIRLPGFSLSGEIPVGVFKNLSSIRTLSLRFNRISGQIPLDLGSCSGLRNVYLQGNQISGTVPDFVFSLHNLVHLNLAKNNLSGELRGSSINNLTRLRVLCLEENQLSGSLPELKITLDRFNVSNNKFNGSVPVSLSSMPVSALNGNDLCGKPLKMCPGIAAGAGGFRGGDERERGERKKRNGLSGGAIAGIVIGCVVAFVVIVMILVLICCKNRKKRAKNVDFGLSNRREVEARHEKPSGAVENAGNSTGYSLDTANETWKTEGNTISATATATESKKLVFFGNAGRIFDLEELLRASAEVLGKGSYGTSYKAVLEIGIAVAVKRLKDVAVSESKFREKIEAVGAMKHENLVNLRAYYYSRDEKLLVYDYLPMGSLSAFLHGNRGTSKTPLNWQARTKIAIGIARGLTYLHSHGSDFSHGNLKSSNVLLTKTLDPLLADFSLSHLTAPSSNPNPSRTGGYRAPEVTDPRKQSQKSDIYSFGVVLMEILTGKAPNHAIVNEEGVDLPRWVESMEKLEVFDMEIVGDDHNEEEMVEMMRIAIECVNQYPDNRPLMKDVMKRIEIVCEGRFDVFDDGDGDGDGDDDIS